ncbi:diaminopropionate ammonia-lyase [Salinicoccus albus]|uniref:diaminopropionate ammonia-lyase n=1 Tax=Salinicoccus albus TaxID=418756 RepID=UPI0003644A7D|nr:diaminopropionate ammonia-lyase [Salinicoccus albus]
MVNIPAGDYKYVLNENFSPEFNGQELSYFNTDNIKKVLDFQKKHELYTNTPLESLPDLAEYLNIADIKVKDESHRFGLNAFKVMGGIYAIAKYLADQLGRDIESLSFQELQSPAVREEIGNITFITATDGNHGRGVAWAARVLGQQSVIYMPKGSLPSRLEAVRDEGAHAEITDYNYDETVRMTAGLAEENGWVMVQDTAWEGYDQIPLWIVQGYAAIAHEIIQELEEKNAEPPTHIFLQAGVGSFAAAIAAYFKQYYKENAPTFLIVEPDQADCYYQSFSSVNGDMEIVTGDMATIMAGLACGEPNPRAFRILSQYATAAFSCSDRVSALGMRILGNPLNSDPRIISGESGAVPLGLLYHLRAGSEEDCAAINLDENARVLTINTEGDTDRQHYLDMVWEGFY